MKNLLSVGLTLTLVACGGGGGGSDVASVPVPTPVPVTASPEGFWEGNASTGALVSLAILENGETWGVYSSGGVVAGALYGNTTSSSTNLTGAGRDFNVVSRSVGAATYAGTFSSRGNINVTTSSGSSFSGTYRSSYEQPASLAAISGSFNGSGFSGSSPVQTAAVGISSSGVVTVPSTLGCSASGTAAPRSSGKNILDVSLTFVGSNCALGNGTITKGIAYYDIVTKRILVMALNPAKSDGFVYLGQK